MREACVGPYERRAVSTKVNSAGNDDPDILIPCRRSGCFDLKGGSRLDAVFRVCGAGVITIAPFNTASYVLRTENGSGERIIWGAIFQSANLGGRPLTPDPVGQPLRGLVVSVVFTNTCATSFPSLPILCFEAFPPVSDHNRGVASAEQRYLLRIL